MQSDMAAENKYSGTTFLHYLNDLQNCVFYFKVCILFLLVHSGEL